MDLPRATKLSLLTGDEVAFANDVAAKYQPMFALNGWVYGTGSAARVPTKEHIAHRLMMTMGEIKVRGREASPYGMEIGRFRVAPVWGPDPETYPREWTITVQAGLERYYAGHELYGSNDPSDQSPVSVPSRWTCSMSPGEHCLDGKSDSPAPGPPEIDAAKLEAGHG